MSRIDVQTLVLAFERRIEALEKNPPDKVSTGVILKMLESSIDDIIKSHFVELARRDLKTLIKKEFLDMKNDYIESLVRNILSDDKFKKEIESNIKNSIINSIKITGKN